MRPKRIILDLDDVLNTLSLDLLRFDGLWMLRRHRRVALGL